MARYKKLHLSTNQPINPVHTRGVLKIFQTLVQSKVEKSGGYVKNMEAIKAISCFFQPRMLLSIVSLRLLDFYIFNIELFLIKGRGTGMYAAA